MTEFHPARLLQSLSENKVDFVLIGGVAAASLGLARVTYDLDIVYRHTRENCAALARALQPFHPYLREIPPGLPFSLDAETIFRGSNFTLTSTAGDIDVFAEVPGMTSYDDLSASSHLLSAFGCEFLCLNLEMLIRLKRAAGRPRDLEVIAQLEQLRKSQP